jgi:hypothetical protein
VEGCGPDQLAQRHELAQVEIGQVSDRTRHDPSMKRQRGPADKIHLGRRAYKLLTA